MPDDTDEHIKNRLKEIFPSPAIASAVVDAVVHDKPLGWGRRSNAPYYKKVYADQMKQDIDKMRADKKDLVYRYDIWCDDHNPNAMSKQTLYNRINQSIRYVCEQMDPNKVYRQWYETVHISREPGLGVCIRFIPGLGDAPVVFSAEEVERRDEMPLWKRKMEDWLESGSSEPFIQGNLALTPDEIAEMKRQFSLLSNYVASINSHEVKIIKLG